MRTSNGRRQQTREDDDCGNEHDGDRAGSH
jgi:hypothetical protein